MQSPDTGRLHSDEERACRGDTRLGEGRAGGEEGPGQGHGQGDVALIYNALSLTFPPLRCFRNCPVLVTELSADLTGW